MKNINRKNSRTTKQYFMNPDENLKGWKAKIISQPLKLNNE
jgi:hypothetical protein